MYKIINDISKEHETWVNIAKSFTKNTEDAEDIVQEVYIKIMKREGNGEELVINNMKTYMTTAIKNKFFDSVQKGKKLNISDINWRIIEENIAQQSQYKADEENFNEQVVQLGDDIDQFLKQGYKDVTWNYKIGIFKLNLNGMSMQEIADKGGWTKRHVQLTIESVRKIIQERFSKEYNAFKD